MRFLTIGQLVNDHVTKKFSGPLSVCDQLREQLELAPNDSLRVLRSDARTLLLERVS
ncbi:MAG: hypothetical protein ACI8W3_003840, partial [Myxococcota bacterium]